MQTLTTTCTAAMDAAGETGEIVFGRREPQHTVEPTVATAITAPAQEMAQAGLGGAVASSEAVDSRAAFESTVGSGRVLTRAPNGDYVSPYVQNDWDVWRVACKDRQLTACNFCLGQAAEARAALASQPGCAVEREAVVWKITTPDGSHSWFTEDAEDVAHFSLPDQGHKIERYAAK